MNAHDGGALVRGSDSAAIGETVGGEASVSSCVW